MKEWLVGGALAVIFAAVLRWAIPAAVREIKERASERVKLLIRELAEPVVKILEIVGWHYDWPGEEKLLKALKELERQIGIQLSPEQVGYAIRKINSTVAELNKRAGTTEPGMSFADWVGREVAAQKEVRG